MSERELGSHGARIESLEREQEHMRVRLHTIENSNAAVLAAKHLKDLGVLDNGYVKWSELRLVIAAIVGAGTIVAGVVVWMMSRQP